MKSAPAGYFLITQPGDGDIDCYSLILQVPRSREAAFLRAAGGRDFPAGEFGQIVYYTAGELSLADARAKIAALTGA